MSLFDSDIIAELESLPKGKHNEDSQDAAALAPPPTAGILGAAAVLLNPKLKEKPHVEIPHEHDIFKPTKSALDILSEQNRRDVEKYLDKFGEQNGYPVIFVTTFRQFDPPKEDIVHEAFINTEFNIQMFKKSEMREAADFARRNGGELWIFDPPKSKEVERLEKERDYWKSRCIREEEDGDTLGIFKHWDD
ncbi:MAG: hypothetical protein IKS96_07410 [Fibrobacter sp.]|nr:hypothetical protein [Fibrobacter sp.]MBR6449755.1 hypothetical protein [Fibrobacter sp.]